MPLPRQKIRNIIAGESLPKHLLKAKNALTFIEDIKKRDPLFNEKASNIAIMLEKGTISLMEADALYYKELDAAIKRQKIRH